MVGARDWTNEEWAVALADAFFPAESAGEPVTFAVDDVSLAQITGLPADEAADILSSVVRLHGYWGIRNAAKRWRTDPGDRPPPSLTLLALTVLAVTRSKEFGLYKEFRKLMAEPGEGITEHFEGVVPPLWEELHWWLDVHLDGARGRSTIRNHPQFKIIGYSLSQAIVRSYDRPLLYRFFRAMRLDPGVEDLVAVELLRALAVWARRQGPRGDRLVRLATDKGIQPVAEELIAGIARGWDGRLRDPSSGSPASPLRLMMDRPGRPLGLVALRAATDPTEVAVQAPDGQQIVLSGTAAFFEPAPIDEIAIDEELLKTGVELSGASMSFFLDVNDAIAFSYDDELRSWVSTARMTYGERHHLLVRGEIRDATAAWLHMEGVEGTLAPHVTQKLPKGWFCFERVRVNARPESEAPVAVMDLLGSQAAGARLRLVGGLRLAAPPRTYLTGGTPNLHLPKELRGQHFEIRTDGHSPIALKCAGHEFELSAFDLASGDYEIATQGGTCLRFSLLDHVKELPGAEVGSVRSSLGGAHHVAGLDTAALVTTAEPVAVPVSEVDRPLVVLADAPKVTMHSYPLWLEELDGPLSWKALDVWSEPGSYPVWALTSEGGRWLARLIQHRAPIDPDPASQWAAMIARSELAPGAVAADVELWEIYRRAAGVAA